MALTDCLKKFPSVQLKQPDATPPIAVADRAILQDAAEEYVRRGQTREQAEIQAVLDIIAQRESELGRIYTSVLEAYNKNFGGTGEVSPAKSVADAVAQRVVPEDTTTRKDELAAKEKEAIQKTATQVAQEERAAEKPKTTKPKKEKKVAPEIRTGETTMEAAGREWNTRKPPGFPTWDEVPAAAQKEFASFGPNGWEQEDITLLAAKMGGTKRSQARVLFKPQMFEGFAPALRTLVQKFQRGGKEAQEAASRPIPISRTPVVLRQVMEADGSKPFKRSEFIVGQGSTVYLKAADIHNETTKHKGAIPLDVLERLPALLADPLAVFKSTENSENPKSFKILLHEQVNGRPIVVAIEPNKADAKLGGAAVNLQMSIFPAASWDLVRKWNELGHLRYYDERSPLAQLSGEKSPGVGSEARTREGFDPTLGAAAAPVKVMSRAEVAALPETAWSLTSQNTKGTPLAAAIASLKQFLNGEIPQRVVVVESLADIDPKIIADVEKYSGAVDKRTQGFVHGGKVYLVASNIAPGRVRSVFMHEAGSHIGLEGILTPEQFTRLAKKVEEWARQGDKTQEGRLAARAWQRVKDSETKGPQRESELVAYFIEEAVMAGVNPSANDYTPLGRWFREMWKAFTAAVKKFFGGDPSFNAQDLVDFAYGAAKITLSEKGALVPETTQRSVASSMDSLPPQVSRPARSLLSTLKDIGHRGVLSAAITQDLADMADKYFTGGSARKYLQAQVDRQATRLEHELRIENILKQYDQLPQNERGVHPDSVNALIHDSTLSGKWAYKIKDDAKVELDPALSARFNKLSPQGQALVRAVFEHGYKTLQLKKQAVTDKINSEFADAIASAPDAEEVKRLEKKRDLRLAHFNSLMRTTSHQPYAPLKRYGDFLVIGKSKAYMEAENAEDYKLLRELEQQEEHYSVEFFDTMGAAEARERDIRPRYLFVEAGHKEDSEALRAGNHDMFIAFDKLRKSINAEFGDTKEGADALRKMNGMLRDLYLMSLGEASARKSEIRRRNVSGADRDMMRALATQGRADAHFLATVKHDNEIQDAIQGMRTEAKRDRKNAVPYLNEFLRRHADSLNVSPHRVEDAIKRATSVWMLTTNPAFYMQQLTQTYMMALPVIGGRFGYTAAHGAVLQAYKDLTGFVSAQNLDRIDFTKAPEDVRDMLVELTRQGKIDIGIDIEMGSASSYGHDRASKLWNGVDKKLRDLNVKVESVNRASAAIAAYRLALRQNKGNKQAALEYAGKVVHMTHGSYDGFNTPRLLNTMFPGARVVTQFRRFQIIQLALLIRMAHNSFKGDERWVARKTLGFLLGHTFVMGGVMGLPGFTALAWLLGALWPDDDEPDDPELTMRRLVGDPDIADVLLKGAPTMAGVNLSGKFGMANVASVLPFSNLDSSTLSRKGYAETMVAAMGPFFGGLAPRAVDGFGLITKGDYYKGLEQLLPAGLANVMKGVRFGEEGVTMRKGDVVMPPDEVEFATSFMQSLGLQTMQLADRQFLANAKKEYDDYYKEKEATVLREYAKAYRGGNQEALQEAREAWNRLQESRVRNGYARQPLSTLLRAPMEQMKRERQAAGGVEYSKASGRFVKETAGLLQ